MFAKFKTAALAAVIGLGALTATPAAADTITFGFNDDGLSVGVTQVQQRDWRERDDRRGGPRHDRDRWDGPRRDRGDGWDGPRRDRGGWDRPRGGCSPWQAVNKAERMGLYRVRVIDAGRHTVIVRGRQDGERVRVAFANAPYCPVLGFR